MYASPSNIVTYICLQSIEQLAQKVFIRFSSSSLWTYSVEILCLSGDNSDATITTEAVETCHKC